MYLFHIFKLIIHVLTCIYVELIENINLPIIEFLLSVYVYIIHSCKSIQYVHRKLCIFINWETYIFSSSLSATTWSVSLNTILSSHMSTCEVALRTIVNACTAHLIFLFPWRNLMVHGPIMLRWTVLKGETIKGLMETFLYLFTPVILYFWQAAHLLRTSWRLLQLPANQSVTA